MSDPGPSAAPGSLEVDRWEWQHLFQSEHGPPDPTTRLVLFVLGGCMTPKGKGCFPSQALIAERSHLTDRAVRTHLKRAEAGRWIRISQRRRQRGRSWHVNEYVATVPAELAGYLKAKPWERAACPDTRHHVPPVPTPGTTFRPSRDTRNHIPRHPEAGAATPGTSFRDTRNHVPTNSAYNKSENVLRTPGAIEISPEERQRQTEEQASKQAEEAERQRAAKAKKEAEAIEAKRNRVLAALKKWPDYTSEGIARCSGSSTEEVEQLRRQA
jgi:hypothetical protein